MMSRGLLCPADTGNKLCTHYKVWQFAPSAGLVCLASQGLQGLDAIRMLPPAVETIYDTAGHGHQPVL